MSHAEEFQIIYVDTRPLRRWSVSPTPNVWATLSDFLPKRTVWKGGKSSVTWEWRNWQTRPQPGVQGQHLQWQVMLIIGAPEIVWWEGHFTSVFFLPKPIISGQSWENHQTNPKRGASYRNLTSTCQNCQGHQRQGTLGPWHSLEEPEETWQVHAVWYREWDPGTEKGH